MSYQLINDLNEENLKSEPIRAGFGRGLKKAGDEDERVVALTADLTDSTQITLFKEAHPDRFIQVGIAEQNLATLASGLAHAGKIPFASSYAAFSPGRNWEQIKTTASLNNQPVKIVGSHAGVTVGPDGATHQMLEDIALMRVMPNIVVVVPGDAVEAEKATLALAKDSRPAYLRLSREKSPIFSTEESPFEIGKAYVLKEGYDVTLVGTGTMTFQFLKAAELLAEMGINAEVVHVPTIKPLDEQTILDSARRTGRVVTGEEAQRVGGLGGAVSEILSEKMPTPVYRVGIHDRFGESGDPYELMKHFRLMAPEIVEDVKRFIDTTPKYHQGM